MARLLRAAWQPLKCPHCTWTFTDKDDLRRHLATEHGIFSR